MSNDLCCFKNFQLSYQINLQNGYEMINILLSFYDFGEDELYRNLIQYFNPSMKVTIIPFSHSDTKIHNSVEYDHYCNKGGEYFELIASQFMKLGIPYNNIDIIHYFNDDSNKMRKQINNSDVIFFTGGLPDKTITRLKEKNLLDTIKSYNGIIMGASAGALIQLPEYFCTPDSDYLEFGFYKGIGLINSDFYIEVHYEGTDLKKDFPELSTKKKPIYAIPDGSGVIYDSNKITIINNVRML